MRAASVAVVSLAALLAACSSNEPKRSGGAETVVLPAPGETPLLEDACCPVPNADGSLIAFTRPRWGGRAVEGERSKLDVEVFVASAAGQLMTPQSLARGFVAGWTGAGQVVGWHAGTAVVLGNDGQLARELVLSQHVAGPPPERVSWLASQHEFLFATLGQDATEVKLGDGRLVARHPNQGAPLGELVVPSPDERYLAVLDASFVQPILRVF